MVVAQAAVAVVVFLEVSAGFVKTVVIEDVVAEVVPVEQVGNGCFLVVDGRQRKVEREVEIQARAAIGGKAGEVIGIAVFRSVNIVTTGDGVFGAWCSVGVVPSKG